MPELTHADVLKIVQLVEQLAKSSFQTADIQVGDLKLILSKSGAAPAPPRNAADHAATTAMIAPAPQAMTTSPVPAAANDHSTAAPPAGAPAVPGGVEVVRAPMVGRFYAQPEPGAPPYVTVGRRVAKDATVGLLQVMKVFSAVKATVSGTVTAVCVENEAFVEYGQSLLRIAPDAQDARHAEGSAA